MTASLVGFLHDPHEGVDADGIIRTGASQANIPPAFRQVLQDAADHLDALDGTHSLYLYGSVATGTARAGSSDVDLVTIGLDTLAARGLAAMLASRYRRLCRGVEIGAAQPADYEGDGDEAYGNRAFLRHYCVHLAGPDPRRALAAFPADRAAARGFNGDIGSSAARWRSDLANNADPQSLARRIARKTLFAVAGLVSVHDATWTTDRAAAARRWARLRPRLAVPLDTLFAWGFGSFPSAAPREIQAALDGIVAEVVREFRDRIGFWRVPAGSPER